MLVVLKLPPNDEYKVIQLQTKRCDCNTRTDSIPSYRFWLLKQAPPQPLLPYHLGENAISVRGGVSIKVLLVSITSRHQGSVLPKMGRINNFYNYSHGVPSVVVLQSE